MGKKLERCVKEVKKKSKNINPYAVCRASLNKSIKRELEIGTRIERKEHGFNLNISRKIAKDHIKEFSKYYTHKTYGLIAIEKKLKKLKD